MPVHYLCVLKGAEWQKRKKCLIEAFVKSKYFHWSVTFRWRLLVSSMTHFLQCPSSYLADPLHAYLGICGLSLIGEPNLRKVHPALNITQRAFEHLQQLQQTWRDSSCSRQHWQWPQYPALSHSSRLKVCVFEDTEPLRGLLVAVSGSFLKSLQLHFSNLGDCIYCPSKLGHFHRSGKVWVGSVQATFYC